MIKLIHSQLLPVKEPKGLILMCRQCGGNYFRQIVINPILKKGKISGGTKQLICDRCGKPISGG